MGGISSYIYSYFYGNFGNNNNTLSIENNNESSTKSKSTKNNNDSLTKSKISRPELKLKYSQDLPKEIISLNNMSIFPSKKIALTANDNNNLYILDDKFKILIKKEKAEKNIN